MTRKSEGIWGLEEGCTQVVEGGLGREEHSACGVGFLASRVGVASHEHLRMGLGALCCVEHRGGYGADRLTGDGAGVMTDIPFGLLGYAPGEVALATLFVVSDEGRQRRALKVFEEVFGFYGLEVLRYRDVPVDEGVLGEEARRSVPTILHAILARPSHCRTSESFDRLLYTAHRHTLWCLKEREGGHQDLFFPSLSAKTVVYKALCRADLLERFYLDLQDVRFETRFVMFHRRFSTNTRSTWDKVQPFRLIGHNGEINTIRGNRSWSLSREKSLGLRPNELLTHAEISDSGSLNELAEGLMYRSSIPHLEDVLAIMMPPALSQRGFYTFWSRAMEPWDGPAFVGYSDGRRIGARLDRNGFRPCRWALTASHFFLASEAGVFGVDEAEIVQKGALRAGHGAMLDLETGQLHFRDPSESALNKGVHFDARLRPLEPREGEVVSAGLLEEAWLFGYTDEDVNRLLVPMIREGKEPIGSMGDTARPAVFSQQPRSLFDFFYQHFAQVTNPPLDYIREEVVTELRTMLGARPNIFAPKELIPPAPGFVLESPVLDLGQMETLHGLCDEGRSEGREGGGEGGVVRFSMTFLRRHGVVGCQSALEDVARKAVAAALDGASILVLTDRDADYAHPPVPSLLMLRAVVNALNESGLRLESSIVVETAEARTPHHIAALMGFGATAVCPNLAFAFARYSPHAKLKDLAVSKREQNLRKALEQGLLKIMAKMGISVVRSYQSAKLFLALGLGAKLMKKYFPGVKSPVGGVEFEELIEHLLEETEEARASGGKVLHRSYRFREHARGLKGEKHSMTNKLSKMLHKLVRENVFGDEAMALYREYVRESKESKPVNLRHLFVLRKASQPTALGQIQPREEILRTLGSGAMSFGAISAESQRDLILAMAEIGGRSNSGEGGENPYYFTEGLTCSVKQLASGRFGVTAEYLVAGEEIQIKMAQGAKPGEGGQLMASKVNAEIARARHAMPHVELISPPPMHDIYSIEDLKELIYELKQLHPATRVSVKLVSGAGIGTIAVGVVKAGADIIHIAGGDGGTGAASLISMRHAGLPWELGLMEVHRVLLQNGLRGNVTLRVDGGLQTGEDIVFAAVMGADEYDFGKLLLVAEGCVMARICEKNTCPTGIATHDPKFKAKYKGHKDHVVTLMQCLAEEVREHLSSLGVPSLRALRGRTDLLTLNPTHQELIDTRHLQLSFFLAEIETREAQESVVFFDGVGGLNHLLLKDARAAIQAQAQGLTSVEAADATLPAGEGETARPGFDVPLSYTIRSHQRATLATLSGAIARETGQERIARFKTSHTQMTEDEDAQRIEASDAPQVAVTADAGQASDASKDAGDAQVPDASMDAKVADASMASAVGQSSLHPTLLARTPLRFRFEGSAGQGFGVFLVDGLDVQLWGEANDSVCKGMSGGRVVIRPHAQASFAAESNTIIGNCALYGATGGTCYVRGVAGDRFAVRNSGALAVVEGVGLHACEYMTNGNVVILGRVSANLGAGMTGGAVYLFEDPGAHINEDYLVRAPLEEDERNWLQQTLEDYLAHTESARAASILAGWQTYKDTFTKCIPKALAKAQSSEPEAA